MMQRTRAAMKIAALALCALPAAAAPTGVIPQPAKIEPGNGSFQVSPATIIQAEAGSAGSLQGAHYLSALWKQSNRLSLPVVSKASVPKGDSLITLRTEPGFAAEAYRLEVSPHRIIISATTAAGLFYGAVTLWQLLPAGASGGEIAAQTITDAPRYPWRGLMLDSARHFQSPAFVRSMIDWMAWHKLNVLHWHLTDDQGWRLEIRKYPRLTSVGAWRVEPGGARYGGFYTQDEVRGIVRFAAGRHVQIVPEIDMPGHATAAIAAYPALGSGTDAGALRVSPNWGVLSQLFNLEPKTFGFLDDVLAEVVQLFPSPVIHIGGDEAVKDEWNASPQVQARKTELGIHDADALQAYFTQRIGTYLATRGRRIVGWDEILQPGLRKDAIVMSWHGVSGAHVAAAAGNDSVLAPDPGLYFDHRQSTLPSEPPGRLNVLSLEDVYGFEPRDPSQSTGERSHVLGLQANLWTEHIQTEERVQWMALPRAAALAEVGWSPAARRRWPDFLERLVPMFARYRAFGLNYAASVFAPAAQVSPAPGGYSLTLSNQLAAKDPAARVGDIRYTLDGTQPSSQSPRYSEPLTLPTGTLIRAAAFVGSDRVSRAWEKRLDARAILRRDSHDLEQCSGGIGLLLSPSGSESPPLAVDIMNPCWIDRGVDLSKGPLIVAAVAPLPFNYEIGAAAAKIRVGDARTVQGELEIHVDGCDTPALVLLPLAPAADSK